jgi:hypothetical protein
MRLLIAGLAAALLSASAASSAAAQDWLSYDGVALQPTSANGLVVIGVDYGAGFDASSFVWRPYDPTTGKLLETRWAGTGAALAGLDVKSTFFSLKKIATNPMTAVRGDPRVKADARGVGYRMSELPPGHYVLEGYHIRSGNSDIHSTFAGSVPAVHVEAGKVTYAGDIAYTAGGRREPATARLLGENREAANAFLRSFPKIAGDVGPAPARTVQLQCQPFKAPLLPFTSCKRETSSVTEIAAQPAQPTAPAPVASTAPADAGG